MELTKEQCEEFFYNALCNGLQELSGYSLQLNYDKSAYSYAKELLMERGKIFICYEDVLMQILHNGHNLRLVDIDDEGMDASITMKDVYERVPTTPEPHLSDMLNETDDACTADAILQTVFYNKIIFS